MVAYLLLASLGIIPSAFPAEPRFHDPDADEVVQEGGLDISNPSLPGGGPELKGSLLIDKSHGQDEWSIGSFRDHLIENGWVVEEELSGPINNERLLGFDVLMVLAHDPLEPHSAEEVAAIQAFVLNGGGLWALHESNDDPSSINSVVDLFGITFTHSRVEDPTDFEDEFIFWPTIHELESHPIFLGVESYGYYAGSCITVSKPSVSLATGDDDTYGTGDCEGQQPIVLAVYEGTGRAVFSGDQTPTHSNYFGSITRLREEERQLLYNILDWLLGATPVSTESTSWGRIKEGYWRP